MGNIYIKGENTSLFRCIIGYFPKNPPYKLLEYPLLRDSTIFFNVDDREGRLNLAAYNKDLNILGIFLYYLKADCILYLFRGDNLIQSFDKVGSYPLDIKPDNEYRLICFSTK